MSSPGYPVQQGYPKQPGYPHQPGYPPQPGYPDPSANPFQPGALPQQNYPAQAPFAPTPMYPNQPGYSAPAYPPQPGFAPQPVFVSQPDAGYNNAGYPDQNFQPTVVNPPPYTPYPENSYEGSNTSAFKADDAMFSSSFTDKAIRRAFIRKVYLILMTQLLVTLGFIALFIFEKKTKRFVQTNSWLYYVSYVTFLVTYISLVCCSSVRRRYPCNVIMLAVFTLAMSYMTAMISCFNDTKIVFYAIGICAIVCLGISLFAIQTKFDFTLCSGFLFVCVLVMFIFGIVAIFWKDRIVYLVYSALIALLFCLFLAYDTQKIMGGRREELSPEEYIVGALQLYLDVVYIFISILGIFGNSK